MAFALLTPRSRQLKALGLKYLVTPKECPYSPCVIMQAVPGRQSPATRSYAQTVPGQTRFTPPPRPVWSKDTRDKKAAGAQNVAPKPAAAAQGAPSGAVRTQAAGTTETAAAWPEDWKKLLARTKPGRICWTYTDLGLDLSGFASPERRRYLQELLAFMHLPQGSNTFWPIGLPVPGSDGSVVLRPDLFWAGIDRLGARCIIVLGRQAAAQIGCTGSQRSHGCLVLETEDINDFASAETLSQVKTFLRNWLQRIPLNIS